MIYRVLTPMPTTSADCIEFARRAADAMACGRHYPTSVAMQWWGDEVSGRCWNHGMKVEAFDSGYQLGIET